MKPPASAPADASFQQTRFLHVGWREKGSAKSVLQVAPHSKFPISVFGISRWTGVDRKSTIGPMRSVFISRDETMNGTDKAELLSLYYTARLTVGENRWSRMTWAAKVFAKKFPYFTVARAYLKLDRLTQ
jgi:hypothetical protein